MRTDLARVLAPSSVAIVGAKDASPTSYGVVEALTRLGFRGPLFAVNRSAQPAHGLLARGGSQSSLTKVRHQSRKRLFHSPQA